MYLNNGRYNLLSVTKIMNSSWKLEGDEKSMSLVKEKRNVPLLSRFTQQEEFCLQ
jgi:hypothetical protein